MKLTFNRTSMESKQPRRTPQSTGGVSFNRTSMESKLAAAMEAADELETAFNRTSMESKPGFVSGIIPVAQLLIEPVWNRN